MDVVFLKKKINVKEEFKHLDCIDGVVFNWDGEDGERSRLGKGGRSEIEN